MRELINEVSNKLVTAYSGTSLLGEDGLAVVSGIAITTLFSLHNYLYNIYLQIGTAIAEKFARVSAEVEAEKGTLKKAKAKVVTFITPTKGAVLAGLVFTPPLIWIGYELMRDENILTKIAGATVVATATFAFGGAVIMMLYPDTKKALESFAARMSDEVKRAVVAKAKEKGVAPTNIKVTAPVVEEIYGFGELTVGTATASINKNDFA